MSKPNIIVVMADDMGMGDISAHGNPICITPNIDRLIGEGIDLSNHYSASPMCAPARASFLTGKYPHRTGSVDVSTSRGLDRINPEEMLISDRLKELGYRTGMVGKWHNGRDAAGLHPLERGFDEFFGFCLGASDYWDWTLENNGNFKKADGRYITDVFTEQACRFIDNHSDEPFFLYLAYNAPHDPLQAFEEDIDIFRKKGGLTEAVCRIYAMIKRMDEGIGSIMELLGKKGIYDNTLILFTSDNGPSFIGENDECRNRFNMEFRGSKGDVLEGGIRVPGIVKMPCGTENVTDSDKIVHFSDWLPTLVEIAGGNPENLGDIDGRSLLSSPGETFFWQWNRLAPVDKCNMAMRSGNYKLYYPPIPEAVRYLDSETEPFREIMNNMEKKHFLNIEPYERKLSAPFAPLLFNLSEDPGEKSDISQVANKLYNEMTEEINEWFRRMNKEWQKAAAGTIGKAHKMYKQNY